MKAKMNTVRGEIKAQEEAAGPLLRAIDDRDYWAIILKDINSRLPEDYIWLTHFEPQAGGPEPAGGGGGRARKPGGGEGLTVQLRGLYLHNAQDTAVVDDFMNKLAASELYTVDKEHLTRSVPNDIEWAWDWSVPLILKNPISVSPPKAK